MFSHPADFTPVCTTELGRFAQLQAEFDKRGVKLIALSCDGVESHLKWIEDIKSHAKVSSFSYPIIADEKRELAVLLGMVDPEEKDAAGMPLTCRAVFVIGKDKKVKLSFLYPASTGRNFEYCHCIQVTLQYNNPNLICLASCSEILRVIDSLQLTAQFKVATPADWKV